MELSKNNKFYYIKREHFYKLPEDVAKELFKVSVLSIEIEVFSYCNRKCWFCPNSFIDRHSKNSYMKEDDYLFVLEQLASIDYDKKISYSRYNEPLSDQIILTRIKQARERLPKALLHTNTNGDYVTKKYIDELYDAGLRSLNIQVYMAEKEEFTEECVLEKMNKKISELQLPARFVHSNEFSDDEWIEAILEYKDMAIRIYARDFHKNGCNRGETLGLGGVIRKSACHVPFYHIYVDYNGNVVPCCNIRSDYEKHADLVLGNIREETLFGIYGGEKAARWRKNIFTYDGNKMYPCASCSFGLLNEYEEDYTLWIQYRKEEKE